AGLPLVPQCSHPKPKRGCRKFKNEYTSNIRNVFLSLKRVEQASEYAIAEAFSFQEPRYLQGLCGPVTRLETVEQLQDHDEACKEARELLSSWMKSKLQLELMSDGEAEAGSVLPEDPSPATLKYERFDDLCSSLEHELESSSAQEYLQHLLQSEAVNCRILADLRLEDTKGRQKLADPRITMELRHKQVKENRLRRQKALELQRQEKALKKSILSEAKLQIQEEDRRKALKAKMEEEEIQREMVKLRKEMAEKRQTMAEARRMEGKRQEESQKAAVQEVSITVSPSLHLKKEEQEKEKQRKAQELLIKIHTNKQRCLQRHFSAWFKLVLEHRIQMGKARALADWKCQLKALRAWRNYTWTQKVQQETQQLEDHLQDQNRKNQLSAEHNRRRLLRCCFLAWQHWSQAETEKRELQLKREETKRKMAQLLEAVSLGKGGLDGPQDAEVNQHQVLQHNKVKPSMDRSCWDAAHTSHSNRKPKFAWQITLKHATLNAQDLATYKNQTATLPQQFQAPSPRPTPAYGSCFEHRYAFQQRLIEEQRQQLQKQQELILELQENQRLSRAKEEAAQAMAVTQALNNSTSQTRELKTESGKQSKCNDLQLQYDKLNVHFMQAELKLLLVVLQKELEKQRRLEREQELQKKARDHYESVLLRKLGMVPWKRLREQAKENLVVAERHHCLGLQRKCLMTWLQHTQSSLSEKVSRAEDFHSHMLLRQSFRNCLLSPQGQNRAWFNPTNQQSGGGRENSAQEDCCSLLPYGNPGQGTCGGVLKVR
uniref:Coiled-coil domain containing 191 n=1 Tax=Anas zonorhyncha TaxID=75864 RepID=A0A8B9VFD6_9AVES